jgi:Ca2+-binding RTX toxin-like protein
MQGGEGGDLLDGGAGNDVLAGGLGGDRFVWGAGDRVTDFSRTEGDQIWFNAALGLSEADLIITQVAGGTRIGLAGQAGTILLQGYFGGFDIGNDFKFDYVPSMDFL